ncbi:uncharacterized protein LOC136089785 [Hydra vulgaris]|uniref:Deoxyuridine 5'-triphosphate nucleotidohydrolase n=1 Tax=Hydra vulgaris TaxID=6087 RepID=A0ABM4DC55_HYDVU
MVILWAKNATMPRKGSPGSAGLDIFALNDVNLQKNQTLKIPTEICIGIPPGYYGQLFTRSSLAFQNINVVAGVNDGNYRGVVQVLLKNSNNYEFTIFKNMAIAQLFFLATSTPNFILVSEEELSPSKRGSNGFGLSKKSTPLDAYSMID